MARGRSHKNPENRVFALIPSAGRGQRMGAKKTLLTLGGRPLIFHTLGAFEEAGLIGSVVLVVPPEDVEEIKDLLGASKLFKKVSNVMAGGKERQDSVKKGLDAISGEFSHVVVHDGARPLVTPEVIERTVRAAIEHGAAVSAVPVNDTIKEISNGFVSKTIPRETLRAAQTPQAFEIELLKRAYNEASKKGFTGTDCSSLVERLGHRVKIVEGSYENIKITTKEDLILAESILKIKNF